MINRFLLSIGLVFLAFSLVSLFILISLLHSPVSTSGKIPLFQPVECDRTCGGPVSRLVPNYRAVLISQSTSLDDLIVEYEWPRQMNINDSDSISIALTVARGPELGSPPTPTPPGNVSGRGMKSISPSSLAVEEETRCTGDASKCLLSNLFGSGYTMSIASAYMITTSIEHQMMGTAERSTDQPLIEWDWNIFPKSTGWQVINVGIDLQWTSTSKNGGTDILRQLWEAPIAIDVNKPFLDVGQLSLSSAILGAFGTVFTGFSLPWMLEQRRRQREDKEKLESSKKKRKYCRYCSAENPEGFTFCNQCGKQAMTLTDTSISAASLSSSPELTGDQHASVGNAVGAPETPVPGSSQ